MNADQVGVSAHIVSLIASLYLANITHGVYQRLGTPIAKALMWLCFMVAMLSVYRIVDIAPVPHSWDPFVVAFGLLVRITWALSLTYIALYIRGKGKVL